MSNQKTERAGNVRLSRRQRKELKRQLASENCGLDIVHPDAAGIDIGGSEHSVAVAPDRDPEPVRKFGCFTADLIRMAEWLKACGIRTVAMQSTGVYWFAVYDVLERHGLEVYLVNAHHTKNLPGRKSDVQESQWLLRLHTFGLLRNSFRPPADIRELRNIWRLRDRHVSDAARSVQHMQKALTGMNIQLANTISDISGTTGMAIIRAIVGGERNPQTLAGLKNRRIQATNRELVQSLEGVWQQDLLFELEQALDEYDFKWNQIEQCDRKLKLLLADLPAKVMADSSDRSGPRYPATSSAADKPVKKKRRNRPSRNAPQSFDLAAELTRICGVDATRIEGVDVMTIQTIVAELGTDLQRHWRTQEHFASWLKLTPQREISGGKVIRHTREKSGNRVAGRLRMCATTLLRSDSYLGARYRALRARLGARKAIKAMARHLACLIYQLFTKGHQWIDLGREMYEHRLAERQKTALQSKARALGLKLVSA